MTVISVITKQVKNNAKKVYMHAKKISWQQNKLRSANQLVFFARKPIPLERYASPLQTNINVAE